MMDKVKHLHNTHLSAIYMSRLMLRTDTQKDTCYNEIGLCAQNKDTILGSIVNTNGRAYVIV